MKKTEKPSKLLPYRESGRSVFDELFCRRPLTEKEKARARELEPVAQEILKRAAERKAATPRNPAAYRAEVLEG